MKVVIFTPPHSYPDEAKWITRLLELPIHRLHLRKPTWTKKQVATLLEAIPVPLQSRVVLHQHYSLLREYRILSCYIRFRRLLTCQSQRLLHFLKENHISWCSGIHRKEDMVHLPPDPAYLFLSPVFPSISKKGYEKSWDQDELQAILRESPCPVFALGGICPETLPEAAAMGFVGVALLGWIWEGTNPLRRAEEVLKIAATLNP